MKVFVAGATGALGKQLVPKLVASGHEVWGTTRSESRAGLVSDLGARPVVLDALDADAVGEAVQRILGYGLDGVTFNMPADGHEPENVAFAGEILTKALA